MTRWTAPIIVLVVVLSAGCERETVEATPPAMTAAEITGESLWRRISEEAPFETYAYWPGMEGVQPGQAPHGPFHSIFVNRTLLEALPRADRVAPVGSIIVKQSRNANRDVSAYTVMAKVDGFDPENGDWFWAAYGPNGLVRAAGSLESCIVCHAGMKSNDYVIVRRLDHPRDNER